MGHVLRFTLRLAVAATFLPVLGCVRYQPYVAAPINPDRGGSAYLARSLADPGLRQFLGDHGAARSDSGLTSTALALAAVYFRPELLEGRASLKAARAGEITAGVRPPPSASATVQHSSSAAGGDASPWTIALTTGLTFEMGGKRNARIARARALTLATGLRLDAFAWRLAQDARLAAVAVVGAERDLLDAEDELRALREVLVLLRARYTEGRVSLADIAQAETDVQTSAVAVTRARRARTDARVQLARSLGISFRGAEAAPIRDEGRSACDAGDSRSPGAAAGAEFSALASIALRQRYEIGAALADYAVFESDLRLAIAQQYPDLTLGPGISWDQGLVRWVLSVGSPAIRLDRNRGPIAEAEARRAAKAAHVRVAEDSVLAQVDSALAGCRDLRGEIAAADSLVGATTERLRLTEAAYARGEIGQTEVALARLALVRVERIRRQALQRRQVAGAALEAALGQWTSEPEVRWPVMRETPMSGRTSPDSARGGSGTNRENQQ